MRTVLVTSICALALSLSPAAQTIDLELALSGAFATPPNTSKAVGNASLSFDPGSGQLKYDLIVSGMNATASHIQKAPPGSAGGIQVPLTNVGPNHFAGTATLSAPQVAAFFSGVWYINVHSSAFPPGEVRGQLVLPQALAAPTIDGSQATPAVSTPATGLGALQYNSSTKTISYDILVSGLLGSPTAAHLHGAPAGSPGPILFPLTSVGTGHYVGTSPPQSDANIAEIFRGNSYINVHTSFAPGGEARGQVGTGFLNSDTPGVGVANGGTQTMNLEPGATHAGELYLLLGSLSGTSPGLPAGSFVLPLNFDLYLNFTLSSPGTPPLSNSMGLIDPSGSATIQFSLPAGAPASLVGVRAHHAAVGIDLITGQVSFSSNPVSIDLL